MNLAIAFVLALAAIGGVIGVSSVRVNSVSADAVVTMVGSLAMSGRMTA